MYVTVSEVRNMIGDIPIDVIPDNVIQSSIEFAEDEIDRLTFTTYYPNLDQGSVTSSTLTSLTDSNKEFENVIGFAVYIYSGTGKGQIREILANTDTTLTVDAWLVVPDTSSRYIITYLNKKTEKIDGSGSSSLRLIDYPIVQIDSLKVNGVSVDIDSLVVYPHLGKIMLTDTSKFIYFPRPRGRLDRQAIEITYHWGVLPTIKRGRVDLDYTIKRAVMLISILQSMSYQLGGTYDQPSTWSLPEMSATIGQQYQNILMSRRTFVDELETFKKSYLGKFPYMV